MAEPAQQVRAPHVPVQPDEKPSLDTPSLDTPSLDTPSLDPSAIERNYRRERARRRARIQHRSRTRRSDVRFYVLLTVLAFLAAFALLAAWHEVQTLFGV